VLVLGYLGTLFCGFTASLFLLQGKQLPGEAQDGYVGTITILAYPIQIHSCVLTQIVLNPHLSKFGDELPHYWRETLFLQKGAICN